MKKTSAPWTVWIAPFAAAALPLMAADCGASNSAKHPDGSAEEFDGTTGQSSSGSGGGSSGTGTGSGTSDAAGNSSGGADGESDAASSGGVQDAGTLCVSPGNPPGCVACLTDNDCPASARRCVSSNCAQCATSADCAGTSTPACWPSTHTCHASCTADGGSCTAAEPICDPSSGACVGCRVGGSDCPVSSRVCDPTRQQCVVCVSDSDCAGTTTPHCDTATNTCAACAKNADCTNPATPICRTVATGGGFGAAPTFTLTCQAGCTSNAQCTEAGAMVCDSNGDCVQCTSDSTCATDPTRPVCDVLAQDMTPGGPYHKCVACTPGGAPGSGVATHGCDGGATSCMFAGTGAPGDPYHYACQ